MALGWLGEGLIVEVLGAVLIGGACFFSGKYLERRRQVAKFYVAIAPVLKVLSQVASAERIPAKQVQRVVREISLSFSHAYLGGPDRLPLRKDLYRATGSEKNCSICDDSVAIQMTRVRIVDSTVASGIFRRLIQTLLKYQKRGNTVKLSNRRVPRELTAAALFQLTHCFAMLSPGASESRPNFTLKLVRPGFGPAAELPTSSPA